MAVLKERAVRASSRLSSLVFVCALGSLGLLSTSCHDTLVELEITGQQRSYEAKHYGKDDWGVFPDAFWYWEQELVVSSVTSTSMIVDRLELHDITSGPPDQFDPDHPSWGILRLDDTVGNDFDWALADWLCAPWGMQVYSQKVVFDVGFKYTIGEHDSVVLTLPNAYQANCGSYGNPYYSDNETGYLLP